MDLKSFFEQMEMDILPIIRRFSDNEVLYKRFLLKFPQDTTYLNIQKAAETTDYNEVEKSASTLKGLSGNMGFEKLKNCCDLVIKDVQEQEYTSLDGHLKKLSEEYNILVDAVQDLE